MLILIILTQILFLVLLYYSISNKLIKQCLLFFDLWWFILLIWSYISPYGGYKVSYNTYILVWTFLVMFNVVYIFTKPFNFKKNKSITIVFSSKVNERILRRQYDVLILGNKVITTLLFISVLILLYYAFKYSSVMSVDSILNARNERFYVGGVFESTMSLLFYNYVISAFKFFYCFTISFSLIFKRLYTKQFWLSIIGLILYSYIGAGRFSVILLLTDIAFMWIIYLYITKSAFRINKRNLITVFKVILMIIIGFLSMSALTAYRRGILNFNLSSALSNMNTLYQQIVGYSIGPLSGLSYLLDFDIMTNHWFFGRATVFNGIDELLFYLLNFFGIQAESAKNILGAIANIEYPIGTENFNALFSCIYWFYSDLGYLGVVIYTSLFAWVEKKILTFFTKSPNIISLMLAIHFLYFMFMTNMIWQINNIDSLIYLIFIYLIYYKSKKSKFTSL